MEARGGQLPRHPRPYDPRRRHACRFQRLPLALPDGQSIRLRRPAPEATIRARVSDPPRSAEGAPQGVRGLRGRGDRRLRPLAAQATDTAGPPLPGRMAGPERLGGALELPAPEDRAYHGVQPRPEPRPDADPRCRGLVP